MKDSILLTAYEMMKAKPGKEILFVLLAVMVVLVLPIVNTFIRSREEHYRKYEFVIGRTEESPTKSLVLYNRADEQVSLWNYTIMSNSGVGVGDSVHKEKCSYFLVVFKKDKRGRYKEFKRFRPSGLFAFTSSCE